MTTKPSRFWRVCFVVLFVCAILFAVVGKWITYTTKDTTFIGPPAPPSANQLSDAL